MERKRLKKFERQRQAFPNLQLTDRDLQILASVYDYRFLDTRQILALHGGEQRSLQLRLQQLFHAGYLDRPREQLTFFRPTKYMIYGLGNKGAEVLAEELKIERKKIDWTTKNQEVKQRYLFHTWMLAQFRVTLTLALRHQPTTQLQRWQQGRRLKDFVSTGGERQVVFPDAFFTVEDQGELLHFFVEMDRSTMTLQRFLEKMRAYWQYWKSQGYQRKYGIEAFRVLTVAKSRERAENLRAISRLADDYQKGSEMFWFTSEESYSLEKPETILQPIWQTPRDERWHSLLE